MVGASPRLRLDPGWLYVAAGLALCAAAVLVPAQRKLEAMRDQERRLADQAALGRARLEAHADFLRQLQEKDPRLIRRLAAAQLNLVPAGETPVLVASSRADPVTKWIEDGLPRPGAAASGSPPRRTLLARLTGGRGRLWLIAAGMVAIFTGLLVDGRGAKPP